MLTALTFAVATVVGLVVTPIVRHYAHGLDLLDQPGGRKIHTVAIPRLGGVAIVLAFAVAAAAAVLGTSDSGTEATLRTSRVTAMLVGIAILFAVGVVDDVRGVRALTKLAFQVAAATAAWWLGLSLEQLHLPWGVLDLGPLSLPITVVWIVGIINAVNLIDGLDGLACGVVLTTLGAFGLLAGSAELDATLLIVAAAAGAAVGFLAYNLHPASIIMGDTGSMFLGFVVATIAISLMQDGSDPVAPWVPIVALGVPIADTVWAVIRRIARGGAVFVADQGHIHHQLLARGLSQRDTMLILTAVSAALGILAVLLARAA